MFAAVFGALMAASWVWPITLYIDDQPDAFDLDEGFVLLVMLVPPALAVLVFAVVAALAQAVKRRQLVKSVFNVGQVVTSAGIGALAFALVNGSGHADGYAKVGAALVGAVCYLVVNTGAIASILASLGSPWRENSLFDGIERRLLVAAGAVGIALPTALLLASQPKFLPLAVLPLFVMRYLGEGHFYARNDRMRLRGLFEATLEVNRSIGSDQTRAAVLSSAGSLLRSPEVSLDPERPESEDSTLSAPVELADRRLWLSVSGRSRTEPFDDADLALLDALASVGAIALANADLYAEVERQKDNLSVITSSLGEGVCAIDNSGQIIFMNPAGASMLGWSDRHADDGDPVGTIETPRFFLDPAMRAMALRQNVTTDDTRFERGDGSYFPVTMTASPVAVTSSRPPRSSCSVTRRNARPSRSSWPGTRFRIL